MGIKSTHVTGVAAGSTGGAKAHLKPLLGDFDILKMVVSRPGVRTPPTAVVITPCLPPSRPRWSTSLIRELVVVSSLRGRKVSIRLLLLVDRLFRLLRPLLRIR